MGAIFMAIDQFMEFAGAVLRSLPDDLDPTTAQEWIENQESLRDVLREALASDGKSAGNTYPLSVDYGRSMRGVAKAGRYDWMNPDTISPNFPTKREGTAEVEVELK